MNPILKTIIMAIPDAIRAIADAVRMRRADREAEQKQRESAAARIDELERQAYERKINDEMQRASAKRDGRI